MGYLTLAIALGMILVFGYWSRSRRLKSEKIQQKAKGSKVYPLLRAKSQAKLRRVK